MKTFFMDLYSTVKLLVVFKKYNIPLLFYKYLLSLKKDSGINVKKNLEIK